MLSASFRVGFPHVCHKPSNPFVQANDSGKGIDEAEKPSWKKIKNPINSKLERDLPYLFLFQCIPFPSNVEDISASIAHAAAAALSPGVGHECPLFCSLVV
ncbi:hypothetical protein V6N12_010292 [Hibiscus sabdariffa]|uniref:Uncharacterized protein n=1 Tax=Hibiscus sabdariffa TaxID=183260 RepID=A0ABR2AGE5_9ROSI